MTRRIAMAILLTSWAILALGGAASYAAIRQALLDELDASLVLRASSLPEVLGIASGTTSTIPAGDRYIIRTARGQTVARPGAGPAEPRPAVTLGKTFAILADGTRVRTVTLSFPAPPPPPADGAGGTSGPRPPLTVVYSGSTERFDRMLGQLAMILVAIGIGSSAVVAVVAAGVARAALSPLRAAAGTIAGINDQTLDRRLDVAAFPAEIRPVGERMNQMLARLEHGLRQRKQFLADAAHELRTPVTGLMTTIEVALRRRQRDGEALARAMDDCLSDAKMLRRLVETLLEQFRMEADPSVARNVEVDVTAVLDLCADAVETLARQKDVTVVRAYPAGLRFLTQPQRLRSVASNLLGNGIEYNRPGGTVELGCEVGGPGLVLSVRNTGQGIAEGDLSHVFEPFYRATSSEHAGEGHAGLGLFLVKSHVEALGGRCELDNRPGQGCTFRVHLPHPTGATETRAADEGRSGADPRRQHFPTPAESHGALMNID